MNYEEGSYTIQQLHLTKITWPRCFRHLLRDLKNQYNKLLDEEFQFWIISCLEEE